MNFNIKNTASKAAQVSNEVRKLKSFKKIDENIQKFLLTKKELNVNNLYEFFLEYGIKITEYRVQQYFDEKKHLTFVQIKENELRVSKEELNVENKDINYLLKKFEEHKKKYLYYEKQIKEYMSIVEEKISNINAIQN